MALVCKTLLQAQQATVMQATPTTWRLLLLSGWQNETSLKILCGGEALPNELAQQLLALSDSVWNLYGPTETTIWSTIYQVTEVTVQANSDRKRNCEHKRLHS